MTFAAVGHEGQQQVCKMTWDFDQPAEKQILSEQRQFHDGYSLFQVVASNENDENKFTYVLYILKKDQEQQIVNNQRRGPEKKPLCRL